MANFNMTRDMASNLRTTVFDRALSEQKTYQLLQTAYDLIDQVLKEGLSKTVGSAALEEIQEKIVLQQQYIASHLSIARQRIQQTERSND